MKLLIVESPAKAKTISKYLDNKYTVRASVGHVRDLPKSNKKAIDIPGGFIPHYEISKGKEKIVSEIGALADEADEVLLATDPDREGEAIAWHIVQAVGLENSKSKAPNPKVRRVVFHEITKEAVQEAIRHPRDIDENLRRAQEARRVLDRLVGYDLSGIIWKKVRYGLSAGRVQSPALRILVEREREIRAFKPEKFWVITADVESKGGIQFTLTCSVEPRDKTQVDTILEKGKKGSWAVKDIEETEAKRSPRSPFITSTLQQAASSRLGFAPSRTMGIAQKLYEAGHITYMRTDSTNLSEQALSGIRAVVTEKFGKELFTPRTFTKKSKNAQEAHEAIRPTHLSKDSAGTTDEQKRLYKLIWQRTVASQMSEAKIMRSKLIAEVDKGSIPDFHVNGSRVLSPGWLLADPAARGEDVELPKVSKGENVNLREIKSEEKETEAKPRYSEAGLIKELEKRGIGRPSTYASIIRTIETRGYVEKINKALKPTDTGEVVSSFLEENFGGYISDTFTADMENSLDDIATGKKQYEKTLKDFYTPFSKEVKSKEKLAKATDLGKADPKFKCPVCGSAMIIKLGRTGKFLSCERFPDCEGALTIDGVEIQKEKVLGTDPKTNLEILLMDGRFGPYVQVGKKTKENKKPRRASVPKDMKLEDVTLEKALVYLTLPRDLGPHPVSGKPIIASIGRFGPYVMHDGDFRSLKPPHDVYTIQLAEALAIIAEPKKKRGFARKKVQS